MTDEGLLLHGKAFGRGSPAVILVHDLDSDQGAWSSFAQTLESRGFLVMTYDMRGHGSSPGDKDIGQTNADVLAAVRFMRTQVGIGQLFLMGAGLGGTSVLNAASLQQVLGVVAVSAPASSRGISALNAVSRIPAPKLLIAAEGDEDRAEAARILHQRAVEPKELALFPGDRQGTKLLSGSDGLAARNSIVQFLDANKVQ